MAAHSLKMVQKMPAGIDAVWDLFSNAESLGTLTPPYMGMKVLSAGNDKNIHTGQVIEYHIRPLFGVRLYWKTEITRVVPRILFVDEQKEGPYRIWIHEHHFKSIDGGVEMTDFVRYQNPVGKLGRLGNTILVKKKLKQIFEYRFDQVESIFGKWEDQQFIIHFS